VDWINFINVYYEGAYYDNNIISCWDYSQCPFGELKNEVKQSKNRKIFDKEINAWYTLT